jgi:superfamily II DNA/RNA helicase
VYVFSVPERTLPAADLCIDVHRLGRTARAGKEGSGLLVLDPMELPFITSKGMKELPLEETSEDELLEQPGAKSWEAKIEMATESVDAEVRAASYRVGRMYPTRFNGKCLSLLTGMAWFLFDFHAFIANQG